jgi:hypothetical protein
MDRATTERQTASGGMQPQTPLLDAGQESKFVCVDFRSDRRPALVFLRNAEFFR